MKKFILVAVLAGALAALLAGTAFAAGPATPAAQGFGPGNGIHTPGTGMTTPGTGHGPGMGMRAGGMMGGGAPAWAGQPEEVETLLGMTDEQIHAERLAGKSLAQIAASKDISEDTLISTILDAKKADLAGLVADGKLTQAQMDLMVGHMQTQVKIMVERINVGPAFEQRTGPARHGSGSDPAQWDDGPGLPGRPRREPLNLLSCDRRRAGCRTRPSSMVFLISPVQTVSSEQSSHYNK